MLYRSLTAFNEPFGDGFVAAGGIGQDIEVPPDLVDRLILAGHIAPIPRVMVAADPNQWLPEALHARLMRVEAFLWPKSGGLSIADLIGYPALLPGTADATARDLEAWRIGGLPLSADQAARRDDLASRDATLTADERAELALLRSHQDGPLAPLSSIDAARRSALSARDQATLTPEEQGELAALQARAGA